MTRMNPQDHHQKLNEQIARILAFGCLGVLLLRILISPLAPLLVALGVSCVSWMMLLYLAIRKEVLLEHAPHATMYSILAWLIVITLASGGSTSAILYCYPLVPMISGLILPRVHTVIITIATALLVFLLVEASHWGVMLPTPDQQLEIFDHSRTLWLVTSLTISASVALYFAYQNSSLATTLRDEARIDFLTRIANRRGLEEELRRLQETLRESETWLSVFMIDIDHFKRFNDQYGHAAGDKCLASMASLLRVWAGACRAFVGRYGGEEFMMILANNTPEEALAAAESIRAQVEKQSPQCVPQSGSIKVLTVTIGVSSLRGHDLGDNFESLLEAADQALYLGKAQGRNTVVTQSALPSRLKAEAAV